MQGWTAANRRLQNATSNTLHPCGYCTIYYSVRRISFGILLLRYYTSSTSSCWLSSAANVYLHVLTRSSFSTKFVFTQQRQRAKNAPNQSYYLEGKKSVVAMTCELHPTCTPYINHFPSTKVLNCHSHRHSHDDGANRHSR